MSKIVAAVGAVLAGLIVLILSMDFYESAKRKEKPKPVINPEIVEEETDVWDAIKEYAKPQESSELPEETIYEGITATYETTPEPMLPPLNQDKNDDEEETEKKDPFTINPD